MENEPKETTKLAIAAPSLFTLGNLACGFFSILAATKGNFAHAGWLILIAAVFDMFDGRVARLLGVESEFGIEMDSLADAISFCAAPAFLMYFMVLSTQPTWGAPIACVYTCFGVLRLAKFNTMARAGEGSKKYFCGLPVPAPAALLASFAISYSIMQGTGNGHNIPLVETYITHLYNFVWFMMLVLALLMVSNVPYAAFKAKREKKFTPWFLLLVVFLVVMLIKFPQNVVLVVFSLYILFGLLAVLYRAFRGIKIEK
ncbi:MAG: CDP-diacylglycerol--serine O-phosphatidyltransferase [Elusimicrobiaceae bacterium]|nr:CDP-diacylglycerol--serine O-phosphatidyltransferase [Elusimicrobiaceae bacterium]MBP5616656.1 CDP-diacylglycerol--serine O-phosphatidyltransferase [Elusimicrobiaceae bacterium]